MKNKVEKKELSAEEKIDAVIFRLFENSKLSPEGYWFNIDLDDLEKESNLAQNDADDILSRLYVDYNALDYLERKGNKIRLKILHEGMIKFLKETERLKEKSVSEENQAQIDDSQVFKSCIETRGRKSKVNWDLVHPYIAYRIKELKDDALKSQDALANEIQEWVDKELKVDVGLSTIKEKLKPYWDFFNKMK